MLLFFNDLKSFFKEKRLAIRITSLLFILLFIFANAIYLIKKDFSISTSTIDNKNGPTIFISSHGDNSSDGDAERVSKDISNF